MEARASSATRERPSAAVAGPRHSRTRSADAIWPPLPDDGDLFGLLTIIVAVLAIVIVVIRLLLFGDELLIFGAVASRAGSDPLPTATAPGHSETVPPPR